MSLYNGTEFNRSLLQFKHSIPFILCNYFLNPPDNQKKRMMKSYNHSTNDSRHKKQGNKERLQTKLNCMQTKLKTQSKSMIVVL